MNEPTFLQLSAASAADAAVRALMHRTDVPNIFCILAGGGADDKGRGLQNWRLSAPWQNFTNEVLVAGTRGDPYYTHEQVEEFLERQGRTPNFDFQGVDNTTNTALQAEWLVDKIIEKTGERHVIISAAEYHVGRGALTFVKKWLEYGDGRPLTLSTNSTTGLIVGDLATNTNNTLEGEIKRIANYVEDVADLGDLHEFLRRAM